MKKRCRTSWFSSDFRLIHQAEIRGIQDVAPLATYHGEIGREATAVAEMLSHPRPAYHGEIGREATVPEHEPAADV